MSDDNDHAFFELRKEGRAYISKVFTYNSIDTEPKRNIKIVFESSDQVLLGEIGGALCLRITGDKRKTQVTALVSQDDKSVKRLSLQTFQSRAGDWFQTSEKSEFTFRQNEFERLVEFLQRIKFIDLSNLERFQIDDVSSTHGPKAIVDADDAALFRRLRELDTISRSEFLQSLSSSLTDEEINIILGRKSGLALFEEQYLAKQWSERQWQDFFDHEQWVFGYGLDYRVLKQFDREAVVGAGGTDNTDKPTVDFLMSRSEYTVLVEIKKPETRIFRQTRGGRAGTWAFSTDFIDSVSQIVEQKAAWLPFSQGSHFSKDGARLTERTKNSRSILVIGDRSEFKGENDKESLIKADTFELFRQETRTIDIITFDELLARARFIVNSVNPR